MLQHHLKQCTTTVFFSASISRGVTYLLSIITWSLIPIMIIPGSICNAFPLYSRRQQFILLTDFCFSFDRQHVIGMEPENI